jgi:electron transport complex protein RnfD
MSEEKENIQEKEPTYIVSSSPHTHSGDSVQRIMLDVIIALIPALAVAIYFFRMDAVRLTSVCVISCVITELVCRKLMKRDAGVMDFSAVITGLLLAFNLPPSLPWWMAIVGSVIAIGIAKQVFGGLGYNPFNPALIGRVALLISFPAAMTTWRAPFDSTTSATALGTLKEGVYGFDNAMALNYFTGNMNGCIGEVSAAALLLGGAYLLMRKVITWHIPVSYLGTVALIAGTMWLINDDFNMPPHFHLLVGGVMLGAIFMATDMVTSPVTRKGMLIFGIGCGVITMLIRKWGGYPEGVSFAILLMNAVAPLINRATKPRVFGVKKA